MTTDGSDVWSTPTMTGLFVAGLSLGAVYAFGYTRLGELLGPGGGARVQDGPVGPTHAHTPGSGATGGESEKSGEAAGTKKRRRRRRGKGVDEGEDGDEEKDEGHGQGQAKGGGTSGPTTGVPFPRVIPGDLEGIDADADVDSQEAPPPGAATSKQDASVKTQEKKKRAKKQRQKQKQGKDQGRDEDEDKAGSETDKEVEGGRMAVRMQGLRSGESTDTSMSPFLSGDALPGSSRVTTKGPFLAPLSQAHVHAREIRHSLSLDTDSSWTHVDRRRLRASKSADGQAQRIADAMDMTSSDLASAASDSPVTDRMDNVTTAMRGARADTQRTLAEKLVPKPRKMGIEDMLEQPDVPTLARVMRVQPPADEALVPGFSWEDYGEVIEDSLLVHDADEEDEGEWGVVKSRHRTRPPQMTTTLTTTSSSVSISTPSTSAAPVTMTKKQRQNARKRELAKTVKGEAEAARLQGLAKHKRELDRLRIIEQSRQGGGKRPSGGMQATVDDRGKLVWE